MKKHKGTSPFFISLAEFWLCLALAAMGAMGTQLHAQQEEQARRLEASRKSDEASASTPAIVTVGVSSIEIDGAALTDITELRGRVRGPVVIRVSDNVPASRLKAALANLPSNSAVSVATDGN
ncbi:MAG: hypothetical protein HY646_14460 [Acidobacteria bacterium]|nr:hypothetical protein [Acidobacteriota bacterium]